MTTVPGITSRHDPAEQKLAACLRQIESYAADFTIYTYGSATAGLYDGGAAAIVTTGPPVSPNVIKELDRLGRKFTSSYQEERAALLETLTWIEEKENYDYNRVLICTDSQSLCIALEAANSSLLKTIQRLDQLIAEVHIQWILGYSDVPGNELADVRAKAATEKTDQERSPISMNAA